VDAPVQYSDDCVEGRAVDEWEEDAYDALLVLGTMGVDVLEGSEEAGMVKDAIDKEVVVRGDKVL
jgi:hypothetical protein